MNTKLKTIDKDRAERRKIRKRSKGLAKVENLPTTAPESEAAAEGSASAEPAVTVESLPEESEARAKELKELEELISPDLKSDVGCSVTGLYDLVGTFCPMARFMYGH